MATLSAKKKYNIIFSLIWDGNENIMITCYKMGAITIQAFENPWKIYKKQSVKSIVLIVDRTLGEKANLLDI